MPEAGPRLKVLIVDDEPPARERLRALLTEIGETEVIGVDRIGGSTDTTISLESVTTDTYRSTMLAELRGATLVGQCGLTRTALVCPFSAGYQAYRLPSDI